MQLILAIDSDPRRSEQLKALVRARFTVDLVQASSAGEGLHALRERVPDLILTAPLLSPFDDGVLDEYLRELGSAATHVQTVRIPMLSAAPTRKLSAKSLFGLGRKKKLTSSAPDGCDPKVFADEIAHYLTRSLEARSTPAAPAQALTSERAAIAQPVEEFVIPEALIEEFAEPVHDEPAPIATAPVVEERFVPGAILDLRPTHLVAIREPEIIVEPEPLVFVEPETPAFLEPEVPAIVDPVATASAPDAVSTPTAPATPAGTSPSFEAALAAIRAAWVKPEGKKPETVGSVPPSGPTNGRPKPLAGSGEVDLTNEIDALEDVVGVDGTAPVADDEPSPDESKTHIDRHKVDKSRKRPERARGGKLQSPVGRDDLGVFDPNQCGFSALVDKLDEVTEDEVTVRVTRDVR